MGWKKIGRGLAKIAPVAARAATAGILGDGVASAIAEAVGLDKGASEDDVEAALAKASPEQYAQMRVRLEEIEADADKQERELRYKTRELETRERKIAADDRDSARHREMAVRDATPRVLTYATLGLFGALCLGLMFREIPEHSRMLLGGLIGILGGEVARQGAYFFGSSRGSKSKDEAIHRTLDSRRAR